MYSWPGKIMCNTQQITLDQEGGKENHPTRVQELENKVIEIGTGSQECHWKYLTHCWIAASTCAFCNTCVVKVDRWWAASYADMAKLHGRGWGCSTKLHRCLCRRAVARCAWYKFSRWRRKINWAGPYQLSDPPWSMSPLTCHVAIYLFFCYSDRILIAVTFLYLICIQYGCFPQHVSMQHLWIPIWQLLSTALTQPWLCCCLVNTVDIKRYSVGWQR